MNDRDYLPTTRPDRRTFLSGLAGLTVAGTSLAAFTGSAAAHFPPELDIDVSPHSQQQAAPHSRGLVRVAVTNLDEVEATADASQFRFGAPAAVADGGGAEAVRASDTQDVDGDSQPDFVLWFRLDEAEFTGTEDVGELRWDRDESREHGLSGVDTVSFADHSQRRAETDSSDQAD